MTAPDAERTRARIDLLWSRGEKVEVVLEALARDRAAFFLRCDACRTFGRLEPRIAAVSRSGRILRGPIVLHTDGVLPLAFDLTGRQIRVLCAGCLPVP